MTRKSDENISAMKRNPLYRLGWNENLGARLVSMNVPLESVARVISVLRDSFLVSDGAREWLCKPSGKLRHSCSYDYPVTGDWVLVHDAVITSMVFRRNMLARGASGALGRQPSGPVREQAIAANLDTVFIVCGLDRDFNVRRIERYLTLVYNYGLDPVVVLTKADLHESPESCRDEVESVAFGVHVALSSVYEENVLLELEPYLGPGRTVAMLGSSGAGKSTLANLLCGKELQLTGTVSDSDGKGRHTTTRRELIPMPQGGMLMDNPGIREVAFADDGDGMESAFPEIERLAEQCRFADCTHLHEPGCAVVRAAAAGDLAEDRLESYRKMKREMAYVQDRAIKSADRIEKERWKDISVRIKNMKRGK